MPATDPKIYFDNSIPGAILIDSGSGTEYAHAYPQGALFFKWDDVAETLAIHATPFDAAPIVPARSWADYTCYVDSVPAPLGEYRDLNNYVTAYCFYQSVSDAVTIGASELHIGNVGGSRTQITVAPTVSTTPYAVGMCVGGKMTITNAMRVNNGTGLMESLRIHDKSGNISQLTVLVFSENPAGSYPDQSTFAWTNPDRPRVIRKIIIYPDDFEVIAGESTADMYIGKDVKCTGGNANLYAIIITQDTAGYSTTTSLSLTFGFSRD